MLQKAMKDWTFEAYLLTEKPTSWFPLTESLKITCARWYTCFVREGLDCFSWPNVLPKISKITVTCPKSVKMKRQSQFWLAQSLKNDYQFGTAKSQQNEQFENLYISSYGEARNITFWQQVNLIQRVSLGTCPQELVMSLPHNYVTLTNIFIPSYRRATAIKFGQ